MPNIEGKVDRKYMAHLFDAGLLCHGKTSEWERIGEDLEEYNVDLSPNTETKQNILGQTSFVHNGYEETGSVDTFYANTQSTLSKKLQEIIDHRYKDDNCKTKSLEVHFWEEVESGYIAWLQDCHLVPQSYGGDTSGYQTPFNVYYVGDRTKGVFNPDTKSFEPEDASMASVYLGKSADSTTSAAAKANKSNLS